MSEEEPIRRNRGHGRTAGLRAELQVARPPLAGIIEGLQHDLEQQDLAARGPREVEALLADYQRRESLMKAVDASASAHGSMR